MAPMRWLRSLVILVALALGLLTWAKDADARLKSEWRFGGSLARTLMSLPIASAVLDNMPALDNAMLPSVTQQIYPGGSLGGLFSRPGLIGGFAAGFLGAGVLGVLFGHGMLGELSGVASFLGLIFQIILIVMMARLIWTWWRVDKVAPFADLSPRQLADAYGRSRNEVLPDIDCAADADAAPGELNNEILKRRDDAAR
jgi:hypothetical protein